MQIKIQKIKVKEGKGGKIFPNVLRDWAWDPHLPDKVALTKLMWSEGTSSGEFHCSDLTRLRYLPKQRMPKETSGQLGPGLRSGENILPKLHPVGKTLFFLFLF